jgi:hypothetical protein
MRPTVLLLLCATLARQGLGSDTRPDSTLPGPSPIVASLQSLVVPGLGQYSTGHPHPRHHPSGGRSVALWRRDQPHLEFRSGLAREGHWIVFPRVAAGRHLASPLGHHPSKPRGVDLPPRQRLQSSVPGQNLRRLQKLRTGLGRRLAPVFCGHGRRRRLASPWRQTPRHQHGKGEHRFRLGAWFGSDLQPTLFQGRAPVSGVCWAPRSRTIRVRRWSSISWPNGVRRLPKGGQRPIPTNNWSFSENDATNMFGDSGWSMSTKSSMPRWMRGSPGSAKPSPSPVTPRLDHPGLTLAWNF